MLRDCKCQLSPEFSAEGQGRPGQKTGQLLQRRKHWNPHPDAFLALWPWETLLTSLNFILLTGKMEMIILISYSYYI